MVRLEDGLVFQKYKQEGKEKGKGTPSGESTHQSASHMTSLVGHAKRVKGDKNL